MCRRRSSVYLHSEKRNPEAVIKGLAWLCAAVQQAPGRPKALFAVRAKAHLDKVLADVPPAPWILEFKRSKFLKIRGIPVHLLTLQSGETYWDGPVLVVDPIVRLLNRVDDIEGVQAVGVVSWNWAEVQTWIQRWNASGLDPQNPLPAPQLPPFSNPVVEDALRKLTRQVNVQTGIIHPSDCEAAFACFVELCDAQIEYNGAEIERWLITQGGWKVKDAADARKVAERVQRVRHSKESKAGSRKV